MDTTLNNDAASHIFENGQFNDTSTVIISISHTNKAAAITQETGFVFNCPQFNFIFYNIIVFPICIAGFLGNGLAMYVFWPKVKSSSTYFLLFILAVFDDIILLTTILWRVFSSIFNYYGVGILYLRYFSPLLGAYGLVIYAAIQLAEGWNILLVTFYRYLAVCHPHRMKNLTSVKKAIIHISIILFLSFVYYIPRFAKVQIYLTEDRIRTKSLPFSKTTAYWVYHVPMFYVVRYIIPFILLTVFAYFLATDLHKQRQRREQMTKKKQDENDVTKTIIITVIIFMVSQSVAPVRRILASYVSTGCGSFYAYLSPFGTLLVAANSAVNFIIYYKCGAQFREQFSKRVKIWNKVETSSNIISTTVS